MSTDTHLSLGRLDNPFLDEVVRRLRRRRPPLPLDRPYLYREEQFAAGRMVQVWFISRGCTHDLCTMCDYGAGPKVSAAEMVTAVRRALAELQLDGVHYLEVSPSGSLLDPHEVPTNARRAILALLAATPAPAILFETRAETVDAERLAEVRAALPGKEIGVMVGLESSNPWVQRFCVNKRSHPSLFAHAADTLRAAGCQVIANVSLGTAFLSVEEAIADAVTSAEWALAHGADWAVLYPLQVKRHTLLAELWRHGRYHATSFWALIEALQRLPAASLARTTISWYRNYYDQPFLDTVTSCPRCANQVLAQLDRFHAAPDAAVLRALTDHACACRADWQASLAQPEVALPERVERGYTELAEALELMPLWRKQSELRRDLRQTFVPVLNPPARSRG